MTECAPALRNAAAILQNGKIVWRITKSLLPTYDVFDEDRDFEPARKVEGLLLSPHRAGAMTEALYEIGRQTVADADLILRGLPPLSCRRAQRETVALSRSKPIERS